MKKEQPFVLTPEMLAAAPSYMPLQMKKQLAEDIAGVVVVAHDYKEEDIKPELIAFPPLMVERQDLKAICMQRVFLGYYFNISFDENDDDVETFDYYASSHIANQLTRYKVDATYKHKAFNIESDFKEFKKFVETEIYNRKMVKSDVLVRLLKGISLFATPENVEKMQKVLNETIEQASGEKK